MGDVRLKEAKFCPKCGQQMFSGLPQFWSLWECGKCGFRGALILEGGKLAAKLWSEWKNRET
ncbi:hypothetical protein A3K79_00970 [Candidatus Bathyarchaeota archaeon RBG_13_46_16b]|nr:MAG: hypothetical protein A3K79_00970 [Candidatus Bathyarchaeota archaeon RBG_13_46_16b]